MKVRKAKYPVGTEVRCRLKRIRGYRLKRGEIGTVVETPITIHGDFWGECHVDFPSVPGSAVIGEGLLYKSRARTGPGHPLTA